MEIKTFGFLNLVQYIFFNEFKNKSYVIISIHESPIEDYNIHFSKNFFCKDVLELNFSDIEETWVKELGPDFFLFSDEDAKKIVNFIKKYENSDIDEILIHCNAGVSRSTAVADAIAKYLGKDNSIYFKNSKPNKYVYEKLIKKFEGDL